MPIFNVHIALVPTLEPSMSCDDLLFRRAWLILLVAYNFWWGRECVIVNQALSVTDILSSLFLLPAKSNSASAVTHHIGSFSLLLSLFANPPQVSHPLTLDIRVRITIGRSAYLIIAACPSLHPSNALLPRFPP